MSRLSKTIAKLIITLFGLTVLLIGGVIVAVNVSPRPFALFVRRQFAEGIGVKPVTPAIYLELSQKVRAERDIEYPSRFKSNQLDIFSPKDSLGQQHAQTNEAPRRQSWNRDLGNDDSR